MFINASQLTQSKAPPDASSVAFQVAIRQQQEFEVAFKRAQERREVEAEATAERAHAEARKQAERTEVAASRESASSDAKAEVSEVAEPNAAGDVRGASVDVEV